MRVSVLALALAIAAPPVSAQTAPADLAARLDSVLAAAVRDARAPGAALAVVVGDSTYLLSAGRADSAGRVAVDARRTRFRTASVAKLFVATTVAVMTARGDLDLGRPITDRDAGFPLPGHEGPALTLRALLTHTAGFDERLFGYGVAPGAEPAPLAAHLAARLPDRGWPVGAVTAYSNYGVGLAALVAERRAGIPFRELASREVFDPLGMDATSYGPPADRSGLAEGLRCDEDGCRPVDDLATNVYPPGFAYSTAADLGRFVAAQLGAGPTPLPAAARGLLHGRQAGMRDDLPGMALGFFEQVRRGRRLLTHSGRAPGFDALVALDPDAGIGLALLSNANGPSLGGAVLNGVFDLLQPDAGPAPAAPGRALPPDLAGIYQLTRYAHRTVERFPAVFTTTRRVSVRGDTAFIPFGGASMAMTAVDDSTLREVGGSHLAGFRRDDRGRVALLFSPVPVVGAEFPGTWERRAWYLEPWFLNEYVSWLLAVPLLVGVAWAVAGIIGAIRRRRPRTGRPLPWAAPLVAAAGTGAFTVFGFGFVARSTAQFAQGGPMVYGLAGTDVALLALGWVVLGAAVLLSWLAIHCLRTGRGTRLGRLFVWAFVLCAWAQVHFLVVWNYLPARM